MDLNFKILWFENDASAIESLEPIIQEYLEDQGFKLIKKKVDRMPDDIEELVKSDSWDLILMDYNLATGSIKGDLIIQQIREHEFYTDVIFYSEDPDFKKEIMKNYLEGVFLCQGRSNLRDKVKKIIDLSIKKNLDVCNLRGLIIAEAIDLVNQMDEIIVSSLEIKPPTSVLFREKVLNEEFFTDFQKYKLISRIINQEILLLDVAIEKPENAGKIPELNKRKNLLTSLGREFAQYNTEVIEIRNSMAHAKCLDHCKNILTCKNEKTGKKEYNEDECKKIRKNLIKHSQKLNTIYSALQNT